jgi:uncharacterized protein YigE (DUF2233 family)
MKRALASLAAVALLLAPARQGRTQEGWQSLVAGLEFQTMVWELPETGFGVELHVLRVDPEVVRLKVLDARDFGTTRLTVKAMAERTGALAVINGGYFDTSDKPVGLVMREGEVTSGLRRRDWGVLLLNNARAHIVHSRNYQRRKSFTSALQTGPRLVVRGRETTLKQTFTRRSAVGIDRAGRIIIVVALTIEPEAQTTLAELGTIMRIPEAEGGLGCLEALSLDGGGSTQLVVNAGGVAFELPGEWPVATALGAFLPYVELPPQEGPPTIHQLPTETSPQEAPTRPHGPRPPKLPSVFRQWE